MTDRTIPDNETYLGDGLYAWFDGFMVTLRAPREYGGNHWVALEPEVMKDFQRYLHSVALEHPEMRKHWNMRPDGRRAAPWVP